MNCDDYLRDPEANASHLAVCPTCRAMTEELGGQVAIRQRPLNLDALPLAAWEGASHRTWPLVAAGAASILILAVVLFIGAGMPPLEGLTTAVASGFTSVEAMARFFQLLGSGLHSAPAGVHVTVAVLFIIINAILLLLLRRAPKGMDV
ncbi:MAG TPA: hypothetical protein VF701_03395 [Thermoanaerobaculia bacterium]